MNRIALCLVILFSLLSVLDRSNGTVNLIASLLRNNVAGPAVNLQTIQWPIDPDEGLRKRREYQAENGWLGNLFVEKLGLGEDGRMEERRIQQRIRDQMGALSLQPPYTTIP